MEAQILLDLQSVEREKRQYTWSSHVPGIMPGICVEDCAQSPSVGRVQRMTLASSRAWRIDSSPAKVAYSPPRAGQGQEIMSLMLQLKGRTRVLQGARDCQLDAGSMCVVDNQLDFHLDVEDLCSRLLVLHLPRSTVLSQYPFIEDMTALKFDAEEPGCQILGMTVVKILSTASRLDYEQQWIALSSIVHLLGLLDQPEGVCSAPRSWRVHRAMNVIEAQLSNPDLTAQMVADEQRISRRQLDRMFHEELGVTLSAHIWERRLIHAAAQLQNASQRNLTITQIAMSTGFEDSAHFTRAFKKRFDISPKNWREAGPTAEDSLGE